MLADVPDWVLRESHSVRTYVTAEYDGETLLEDVPLDAGVLQVTADVNIPGRLDLSIPSQYAPRTWLDPINIFGQRLSVRQVLSIGPQQWTVPLGVYRIQAFNHRQPSMDVEALSLEQLIADYRFNSPYQRPAGATFASTLKGLCKGLLPVDTSTLTDRALPASLTTDWEEDRLAAVRGIQTAWPCDLRVDPDGVLVASPERLGSEDPPHVTWTHGEADAYVSLGGSGLRDEIYNSVVARGEKADGTPVQATVVDDNPSSPTYFYGAYGRRQRFYESPLITNVAQAQTAAQTVLRREQRRFTRVVVEAPPDPRVEVLDTARVTTDTGEVYTGQVVSIELPLTPQEGAATYEVAVRVRT